MVVNDDWSTGQMVAVAELLDDLLYVNHSRYQEKLYAHWKATGLLRACEEIDERIDTKPDEYATRHCTIGYAKENEPGPF